jgi:hypothetical protein
MSQPTNQEVHNVVTWLRSNNPEKLAAEGLNYLRSLARTGDALAAMKLRALGAMEDPTGAGLKTRKGKGAAPLAVFLLRAVKSVRARKSTIEDFTVRSMLMALPPNVRNDPNAWFSGAWTLYELSGGPDNDETVRELGNRALKTGEKPNTAIKRAVKKAWDNDNCLPTLKT